MTWGNQNSEAEGTCPIRFSVRAWRLILLILQNLYPVPATAETQGLTSKYIGKLAQ